MRFSMKDFDELSSSSTSSQVSVDVNGNVIQEKKTEISESRSNEEKPENIVEEYKAPEINVKIDDPIYERSNHESETFDSLNRDWNSELNTVNKQAKISANLENQLGDKSEMDDNTFQYKGYTYTIGDKDDPVNLIVTPETADRYQRKAFEEASFKSSQLDKINKNKNRRGRDMSVINRILKFRNFSEEDEKKEVLTEEIKDTEEVKPEAEEIKEEVTEDTKPEIVAEAPTEEKVEEQISETTPDQPVLSEGWATGAQEDMLADSGVTVINPANEGYEDKFDELAQLPEYPIEYPIETIRPEDGDEDEFDQLLESRV